MNELNWVEFLKRKSPKGKGVLLGIGDDCALARLDSKKALLKSDLFIENTHFKLKEISFENIGKRAVARVLSDFAACGGMPKFIGVSLGRPEYVKENDLKSILKGVLCFGRKYGFSLAGGDTSRSKELFLDVWGLGEADKCVLRSTAKDGDYVFLSGKLGQRKFNRPFEPRIKEARYLVKNFKVNAMIDVSDGFIIDLYRILKESKKGAVVYGDEIPSVCGEADWYRGEDYELVFTVSEKDKRINELKKKFYCVGKIAPAVFGYKIKKGGVLRKAEVRGYVHF